MLLDHIKRIPEFAHATPSELRALALHTQVIHVPAGRWLVRPGRWVSGYFYLLDGRLRTLQPNRRLRPLIKRPLKHFYPGCEGAVASSACRLIRIDSAHREFVMLAHTEKTHSAAPANHGWLSHFLNSHMMQRLAPSDWQRVLRGCRTVEYAANEVVVSQGQEARCCFVIVSGVARVQTCDVATQLHAGDFFGEDALVLGGGRTATVIAHTPLELKQIEHTLFVEVLLERLVKFVSQPPQSATLLELPHKITSLRQYVSRLPVRDLYCVCGGSRAQRALVTLLLLQQGREAQALNV